MRGPCKAVGRACGLPDFVPRGAELRPGIPTRRAVGMERAKGFEPSTATLARWSSTTELRSPGLRRCEIYMLDRCTRNTFFGSLPESAGEEALLYSAADGASVRVSGGCLRTK
jgi:hypothetical protein